MHNPLRSEADVFRLLVAIVVAAALNGLPPGPRNQIPSAKTKSTTSTDNDSAPSAESGS